MIYQRLAKVFLICSNPSEPSKPRGIEIMDKTQAKKIRRQLRALERALHKAGAAIHELDEEERQILRKPLFDLEYSLHFEMLEFVYRQHPELRPPPVPPTICSDLRWNDVKLPESVSEADLDAIIFSVLTSRRQKAAKVIGNAVTHCREHNLPINDAISGARIEELAKLGRIEAFGDLRLWGHSEVKLKD
jgi:hypothetical protein